MNKILVVGGGGHAKVLISLLNKLKAYAILGYTDPSDNNRLLGVPYIGTDDALDGLKRERAKLSIAVGIGHLSPDSIRRSVIERIVKTDFIFPTLISPCSIVNEEVALGRGSMVFDGAIINSGTEVDEWAIINTKAVVEHDVRIGSNVHVAPGAVLCGGVVVGNNTVIGAGAVVIQNVRIARNSLIGAGSVVVKDIVDPGTYAGVPAKRIR